MSKKSLFKRIKIRHVLAVIGLLLPLTGFLGWSNFLLYLNPIGIVISAMFAFLLSNIFEGFTASSYYYWFTSMSIIGALIYYLIGFCIDKLFNKKRNIKYVVFLVIYSALHIYAAKFFIDQVTSQLIM
ncbi:hypothetical protein KKF73_02840 [Patescibacteria group bacterium]|nr:hypothetical protein [Patescibacteria group bacterium]